MSPNDRPTLSQLETGALDLDDAEILARAARIYDALDPVPAGLTERIRFGLTLDALDAEIAELQRSEQLAGVRTDAVGDVATVTFTSRALTTMVTITPASAVRARIDGWVAPGGGVDVELRILEPSARTAREPAGELPASIMRTSADSDGRFVFADVPRGLAQFVLRPPGDRSPIITPSLEI